MPYIEVNVFEDELNQSQKEALIKKITTAVTDTTSEKLSDVTWVVIKEVASGSWGVGGNALGLQDIKKLIAEG